MEFFGKRAAKKFYNKHYLKQEPLQGIYTIQKDGEVGYHNYCRKCGKHELTLCEHTKPMLCNDCWRDLLDMKFHRKGEDVSKFEKYKDENQGKYGRGVVEDKDGYSNWCPDCGKHWMTEFSHKEGIRCNDCYSKILEPTVDKIKEEDEVEHQPSPQGRGHKLHSHPSLEQKLNLSPDHYIIDAEEYYKAKKREAKEEPPFTATPEDYQKENLARWTTQAKEYQKENEELILKVKDLDAMIQDKDRCLVNYEEVIEDGGKTIERQAREIESYNERHTAQITNVKYYRELAEKENRKIEGFKEEIEEYKHVIGGYKTTINDYIQKLHEKELEIGAMIAAGNIRDTIDRDILEDVKQRAREQSEAMRKPPFLGICPTCGRDTLCNTWEGVNGECDDCEKEDKAEAIRPECLGCSHNYFKEDNQWCKIKAWNGSIKEHGCNQWEYTDEDPTEHELKEDLISKPNHYNWHPAAECKDIVSHFVYNKSTAIAYVWRSEHKGTEEDDIRKAIQHLQFELDKILGKGCGYELLR